MLENGIGETKDALGAKFKMVACYTGGIAIENVQKAAEVLKKHNKNLPFMFTIAGTAERLKALTDSLDWDEDLYIKVGEKDDPENPVKPGIHHSTYRSWLKDLDGKLSDEDKKVLGFNRTMKIEVKLA